MLDVIEALRKRIDEHQQKLSEHMMAGGANDHEEYMYLVGKAQGFRAVLQDIEEIEQRYIED